MTLTVISPSCWKKQKTNYLPFPLKKLLLSDNQISWLNSSIFSQSNLKFVLWHHILCKKEAQHDITTASRLIMASYCTSFTAIKFNSKTIVGWRNPLECYLMSLLQSIQWRKKHQRWKIKKMCMQCSYRLIFQRNNNCSQKFYEEKGLWCLTIFLLYHGGQFYWLKKPKKTTDMS